MQHFAYDVLFFPLVFHVFHSCRGELALGVDPTTHTQYFVSSTMDERSSKRARQQRGGAVGGGLQAPSAAEDGFGGGGGGGGFPRAPSLAGCHLRVEAAHTHLFIGMPIELKVSLLNDEDVVQPMTQGINVSITGEDGKVQR